DTSTFRQRLVIYPNLSESGEFRAQFDAGLAVAINDTMSLTATLTYRYNSDPGLDIENGDLLFVTGISAKLEYDVRTRPGLFETALCRRAGRCARPVARQVATHDTLAAF